MLMIKVAGGIKVAASVKIPAGTINYALPGTIGAITGASIGARAGDEENAGVNALVGGALGLGAGLGIGHFAVKPWLRGVIERQATKLTPEVPGTTFTPPAAG